MCFGTKTKTTQHTESKQAGESQSQIYGEEPFQEAQSTFFGAFPQAADINTGPNQYQTAAADALQFGPGTTAANEIAQTGIPPGLIQTYYDPYEKQVIDATRESQGLATAKAVSGLKGGMGTRGSLGNTTGGEAALRSARATADEQQLAELRSKGFTQAGLLAAQNQQTRLAGANQATTGAAGLGQIGELIRKAGLEGQTAPLEALIKMSQGAQPFIGASGVDFSGTAEGDMEGTSKTTPGLGNTISAILGTALKVAAMTPSDDRLKDMEEVGRTHDGKPLYAFKYKPGLGLPTHTQIGLSAQDMLERDPGAVGQMPGGFLGVDYDRALAPSMGGTEQQRPMRDGGDIMGKVARAFSMIRGMRRAEREERARGGGVGGRPGMFLGGLLGSSESLGTSEGGWDTTVNRSGMDLGKLGASFDELGNTGMSGGGGGGAQGSPMAQTEQALAAALQAAVARTGKPQQSSDGGRVGYDDGGMIGPGPWTSEVFPAMAPSLGGSWAMPPVDGPASEADWPQLGPGLVPPADDAVAPWSAPNYPYDVGLLPPPQAASPTEAAAPPAATWAGAGPVVVEREATAAPTAAGSGLAEWWNANRGNLGEIGEMLMMMGGPLATGEAGKAMYQGRLQGRELEIRKREAERQARALEQSIAHQQAVLQETQRHHREAEKTPEERMLVAAGFTPGTPEFREELLKLRRRSGQTTPFDKESQEAAAKQAQTLAGGLTQSRETIDRLNQLEAALSAPGVPQGALADWHLSGKRLVSTLFPNAGIEGVREGEVANAITSAMALSARATGNGQGMPGAMSDADRQFLVRMQPGILLTPAGNKLLIQLLRETETYRMRTNSEAVRYINERQSNAGLHEHMTAWMAANPMQTVVPTHTATRAGIERELEAPANQRATADANLPTMTPADAAAQGLTRFRGRDGRIYERQAQPSRQPPGADIPDSIPVGVP